MQQRYISSFDMFSIVEYPWNCMSLAANFASCVAFGRLCSNASFDCCGRHGGRLQSKFSYYPHSHT